MIGTALQAAVLIFGLRLVDVSLATIRMMMVVRGRKAYAWVLGFLQALVFIFALQAILADLDNWLSIAGYAAGFATGVLVGMLIDDRLALGFAHLSIVSPHLGSAVAELARGRGYAVTEIPARGKDGAVTLLACTVQRKKAAELQQAVHEVDPQAFIIAENVRLVRRGFWGS